MESPLLSQHLPLLDKSVFQNCTQFFTKLICSKFPPQTAYIATTGGHTPSTPCFPSLQIGQNPAFFEEILDKFWKRAKSGFRALWQLLPDLFAGAASCVLTCLTLK
jgi:hypothetical protein